MNFLETYLEYTKSQETTERVHRWVGLQIIAAALERRVWINRGHYTLYPNLYVFVVGPSGKVKKSTSTAIGVNLLRELKEFKILSERLTAASLIDQLSKASRVFHCGGRDIKQAATFAYGSELKTFLGEVFGSITELLTTFYDCVPHDSEKPWIYETRTSGVLKIYGPCINFLGATTPDWLRDCISPSELSGGFASRIIFVVESQQRRAIAWPDLEIKTNEQEAQRRVLVSDLKRIYTLCGAFRLTEELRQYGKLWYEKHTFKSTLNQDARFSGYYARKFDTILKLAMSISVSRDSSLLLDVSHFEEALSYLDDVEQTMIDVFGSHGENPNASLTERVWELVRSTGKIKMSQLLKLLRRDTDMLKLTAIVTDLRVMGRVRQINEGNEIALLPIEGEKPL